MRRRCFDACRAEGLRTELDDRAEKMGAKIRDAELAKIPYMAIVGQKELESKTVSVGAIKAATGFGGALSRSWRQVAAESKKTA